MADVMTPEQRKKAMRSNRGRTKPERALAMLLWRRGLRYLTGEGYRRLRGSGIPGHPDLVFLGKQVIVFVDGCFWHGCPTCKRVPPDMTSIWLGKIRKNIERDRRVTSELEKQGWIVIRVWEHTLKTRDGLGTQADELARRITTIKGEGRTA